MSIKLTSARNYQSASNELTPGVQPNDVHARGEGRRVQQHHARARRTILVQQDSNLATPHVNDGNAHRTRLRAWHVAV